MLKLGTFIKSSPGSVMEAGSSTFSIKGYGKRILKGVLTGTNSAKLDLVLNNVYLVEGFHTNIISEALLTKAGLWYHSRDYTLRFGSTGEGVVVRKLERVSNLVFLEYNPLYTCYSFAS